MKLSLSVHLSDILAEKKNILENLFSWGSFLDNGFRSHHIFSLVKEGKFDGIELVLSKNTNAADVEKLKAVLTENGIAVLSVHQPILTLYQIGFGTLKKLLETAAHLSAKMIVVHLFAVGRQLRDPDFRRKLKLLEEKYGVKIGFENGTKNILLGLKKYCFEGKKFSEIVSNFGFDIIFDTTHLAEAGGDIIDFYKKNKERIMNIHLSDYKSGPFKNNLFNMHLPIGDGVLDITRLLRMLKEDNYKGILTIEINRGIREIMQSVNYVRYILGIP